jgi:hypothetical protein
MLDYRAWIIAGLILLSAAGAYVIWLTRPRAVAQTRSLSAAGHPSSAASKTSTLHVEGCNEDFIVKPGELVEPRAVPGASLDQFRNIYGTETKHDKTGILTWDRDPYSLTEGPSGSQEHENFVQLSLNQGHVIETLDGVDLGIDSFGAIFRQMRDRKVEAHESIEHSDNNWTLRVSMYSACGHKFRSEYSRTIPGSPEVDRLIAPRTTTPDGHALPVTVPPGLWRSDIFMNKVIFQYALTPSNGHDAPMEGSPSEHD